MSMEGQRGTTKSNIPKGVRKGAWTKEEDTLLKKCIETYGEGKWHLVPPRAGLNRCRKSCRLRWLNYLRPSINRGRFTRDEVDLIMRLHKLLGNRWTLIAGRLPGRTANDVKNFWNTHIPKKILNKTTFITDRNIIIRPRPSFPAPPWPSERSKNDHPHNSNENPDNKEQSSSPREEVDECIWWWINLLRTTHENGDNANLGSIC